jgi:hypothetical protein
MRSLSILSTSSVGAVSEVGSDEGRAAESVMGISGLSFAGSGGAGACSVDRHIALVGCKQGIGVWEEGLRHTILVPAQIVFLPRALRSPHCHQYATMHQHSIPQ